jgi:hypothetical protein
LMLRVSLVLLAFFLLKIFWLSLLLALVICYNSVRCWTNAGAFAL